MLFAMGSLDSENHVSTRDRHRHQIAVFLKACCFLCGNLAAMAPKKETAAERSQRLACKADEIRVLADYNRACAVMKYRPEVISSVQNHMQAKGWWDLPQLKAPVPEGREDSANAGQRTGCDAFEQFKADFPHVDACPVDLLTPMHRNYNTWSSIGPKGIRAVLHCCEPVSLNSRLVMGLAGKHQREAPKDKLLELLEFIADIDGDQALPFDSKDPACRPLWELCQHAMECNESLGRRARDLHLPQDWSTVFRFNTKVENDILFLVAGDGSRIPVPKAIIGTMAVEGFYVEKPFSQSRALLRHRMMKTFSQQCSLLIMMYGMAEVRSAKRDMIGNGGSASGMAVAAKRRRAICNRISVKTDVGTSSGSGLHADSETATDVSPVEHGGAVGEPVGRKGDEDAAGDNPNVLEEEFEP